MDKVRLSFDEIAHQYDKQREQFIPCYHDFYQSIATLSENLSQSAEIVDLGAGTGLLTSFLMQKLPNAHYTLVDFADEMLSVAKQRFAGNAQVSYYSVDYKLLKLPKQYNAIVSSLSIHHLTDDEKKELYQRIYIALKPGGVFINGDLYLGRTDTTNELNKSVWFSKIDTSSLTDEERQAGYYRMTFDKPSTVQRAIDDLEQIGFVNVDLFYKYFRFGVVAAQKSL